MTHHCNTSGKKTKKSFAFPLVLIIGGILLLSSKLQLIPAGYSSVVISWQMLVIAFGLFLLFKRNVICSLVMLSIGTFFIVPRIAMVPDSFITDLPQNYFGTYWPALLIAFGIIMVLKRFVCTENTSMCGRHFKPEKNYWKNEEGYINKRSSFQSSEHIVLENEFKGGNIHSSFGELTIDLRKTKMAEGEHVLHIKVSFGQLVLILPEDLHVKNDIDVTMGELTDKRNYIQVSDTPSSKLILLGAVSFGAIELRN